MTVALTEGEKPAENYIPPEGADWTFNKDVTDSFDNMLLASIPGYLDMRRWVDMILTQRMDTLRSPCVVDLGSSRGEVVARHVCHPHAHFELIEVSEPMRDVLTKRFGAMPNVCVRDLDIRYAHPAFEDMSPDVVTSVLTTIFTPVSHRQAIVESIQRALAPRGGLFIWVEKVLGDSARGDEFLKDLYYQFKADSGYTQEAIERKKLSLEFAQVPLASPWNEDILRQAGFKWVQKFWQNLNFCGWVAQA